MARAKPGPKRKEGPRYSCGKLKPLDDPRPTPEQQEMRRKLYGAPQASGELIDDPLNRIAWLTADQRNVLLWYRADGNAFIKALGQGLGSTYSFLASLQPRTCGTPTDERLMKIDRDWKAANAALPRNPDHPVRRAVRSVCLDMLPARDNDHLRTGADLLIIHYAGRLAVPKVRAFGPPGEFYERGATEERDCA